MSLPPEYDDSILCVAVLTEDTDDTSFSLATLVPSVRPYPDFRFPG